MLTWLGLALNKIWCFEARASETGRLLAAAAAAVMGGLSEGAAGVEGAA